VTGPYVNTTKKIVGAEAAIAAGSYARVYGEELLSAPVAGTSGTILDQSTLTGDW
jgi:hypothetical protein